MPRPKKNTASWFPHDTDMSEDEKIICICEEVSQKYGYDFYNLPYAFYNKMLEFIGKSDNFCVDIPESSKRLLAVKFHISLEKFEEILSLSLDIGLFVCENNVLYSKGFQKRMMPLVEKRKKMRENALKRWGKNESNCNAIAYESDAIAYKNDAFAEFSPSETMQNRDREIYIKHSLTEGTSISAREKEKSDFGKYPKDTGGETQSVGQAENTEGIAKNTETNTEKKSVLFEKFFAKFPKKTYRDKAQSAFLKLKKSEIEAISRVFPFWLDVWKHQAIEYLPNAYDWLYNKRWKEPLPSGYPTHIPADSAPKPNPTPKPRERIKSAEPPQADRAEREEILRFFRENLSPEMREKIEAEADAKFAGSLVKKWDLLYSIEIAKLTKPHYPKK